MKRLRSSDDLDSYSNNNEKASMKDSNSIRSSRSFFYKSDNVRKGLISTSSSSSRYDRGRSMDDDSRESSRIVKKRPDHDFEGSDRRKGVGLGFDRYGSRDREYSGSDRNSHRSESFCGSRREFPKGFRSERDRSRREGSVSSWRRIGATSKEFEEGIRCGRSGNEERLSVNAATRSSPKGLRDVKSPTWSRDSGSEQTRVVRGVARDEAKGKPSNSKSRSSPTWSKDSGSEQSKSVEVAKKNEVEPKSVTCEMEVKSVVGSGHSSEMEEGELEPEPESAPRVPKENEADNKKGKEELVAYNADQREVGGVSVTKGQVNEQEKEPSETFHSEGEDGAKKVDKRPICGESLNDIASAREDAKVDDEGGDESQSLNVQSECKEEERQEMVTEKLIPVEEEKDKTHRSINLESSMEDVEAPKSNKEVKEEKLGTEMDAGLATEGSAQNLMDKGKSVVVSPAHAAASAEDGAWIERDSRDLGTCRDEEDDTEETSNRGFDLFTSSPVRRAGKPESSLIKPKDEQLVLEPLDLSLSLPNVLLPIGASKDAAQAPCSPSHGRSVQSFSTFRTNSDGFTASMSFSGSQSFFHNPSCSLTQNSMDMDNYEQSVHSRPIFQGIDQGIWQAQPQNDSKHKDVPLYQKVLINGNGSVHQSRSLQGLPNGQGSSKMPSGLDRQLSFHKQLSGQTRNHDETRSPSQSVGSHDIGSSYGLEKKRSMKEKHGGSLYRSNSQKEQEQFLIGGVDFVETLINRIVSEPVHVIARKFHEVPAQSVSLVKETIREMMLNADKQGQLYAFQSALQHRTDVTLDILLKSHRLQLEILVALKTGLKEYLQVDNSYSSSDLAEVFLNLRCRNLACQSPVPVDECDCKVCGRKDGFCSACMCLVCSKFDMASQTCSWVGCDVCLHWCHTDCALRESYIKNGRSETAAQGSTEMQFHCVACAHPSEMFGFVKEVYQNFAKTWTAETFCKELEYVKRIFFGSKDIRGRMLYEIAVQMLEKLANKSNLPEVYSTIMSFLNESDSSKFSNTSFSGKEQGHISNGAIAGRSQDVASRKSVYTEKAPDVTSRKSVYTEKAPQLERSSSLLLPSFTTDVHHKHQVDSDMGRSTQKEPLFDELESIVRIKHAEAKMFQARADDARREAEGLKRIAIAKNEKIEEEYTSRISKLRLVEAEEMRKQKLEEFQALDRAHREYFSMKMRMEADIKDLLMKMEATKRSLTM